MRSFSVDQLVLGLDVGVAQALRVQRRKELGRLAPLELATADADRHVRRVILRPVARVWEPSSGRWMAVRVLPLGREAHPLSVAPSPTGSAVVFWTTIPPHCQGPPG